MIQNNTHYLCIKEGFNTIIEWSKDSLPKKDRYYHFLKIYEDQVNMYDSHSGRRMMCIDYAEKTGKLYKQDIFFQDYFKTVQELRKDKLKKFLDEYGF